MENNKKGNIKGLVIVGLIIVICLIGGFWFLMNKNNTEKQENAIRKLAVDYFDKYVSVNSGSSAYKITLGMLKEANEDGESYDLKEFANCSDDSTYALVSINFSTGKVANTEVKLNCK